ncbi:hypothetical protein GcM3_133004 [Golovinomyces cichoracearum]|uniref:Uncharacterized protein n=1 Tax=Golovinomyces cichoracearum TaxID=62708 RepID=A0A420I3I0_9PEZI|nr:hypothetical protein GcM3_133004 [Golovinomyces cichoracearum]
MLERLVAEKKKREAERIRLQDEAFAKAHAIAIETNATHVSVPRYLPVCLTRVSGIPVRAPTVKAREAAASALTVQESSANMASTSADNASEKKLQTSDSSSTDNIESSKTRK